MRHRVAPGAAKENSPCELLRELWQMRPLRKTLGVKRIAA